MRSASKMRTDTANLTMDSLALPRELYWDGKVEPTSPLPSELFSLTEPAGFWLNDDNIDKEITVVSYDDLELQTGMELLHDEDLVFELYDLKEEWPENKLPLLDLDSAITYTNTVTKVQKPFDVVALKSENFDKAVLSTLTPPQSPPQPSVSTVVLQNVSATERAVNFEEVLQPQLPPAAPITVGAAATQQTTSQIHAIVSPAEGTLYNLNFGSCYGSTPFTPSAAAQTDDDKRNSQIVDEFLKSCIKGLPNLNDDCESMSSSSYSMASRQECSVTDDDWSPDSSFSSSASSSPLYDVDEDNTQSMLPNSATPKKRTRPYGRGVEDRKIRKKEQNKNAATRYRQKKKIEMENVLNEEQQLAQRNTELKRVLAERQREAKYLKTLIKEFYKKRQ